MSHSEQFMQFSAGLGDFDPSVSQEQNLRYDINIDQADPKSPNLMDEISNNPDNFQTVEMVDQMPVIKDSDQATFVDNEESGISGSSEITEIISDISVPVSEQEAIITDDPISTDLSSFDDLSLIATSGDSPSFAVEDNINIADLADVGKQLPQGNLINASVEASVPIEGQFEIKESNVELEHLPIHSNDENNSSTTPLGNEMSVNDFPLVKSLNEEELMTSLPGDFSSTLPEPHVITNDSFQPTESQSVFTPIEPKPVDSQGISDSSKTEYLENPVLVKDTLNFDMNKEVQYEEKHSPTDSEEFNIIDHKNDYEEQTPSDKRLTEEEMNFLEGDLISYEQNLNLGDKDTRDKDTHDIEKLPSTAEQNIIPVQLDRIDVEKNFTQCDVSSPERDMIDDIHLPERKDSPIDREDSPIERDGSPLIEQENSPVEREDIPIERTDSPVERVDRPIQREDSPIERVDSPIQREDSAIEREDSPIEQENIQQNQDSSIFHGENLHRESSHIQETTPSSLQESRISPAQEEPSPAYRDESPVRRESISSSDEGDIDQGETRFMETQDLKDEFTESEQKYIEEPTLISNQRSDCFSDDVVTSVEAKETLQEQKASESLTALEDFSLPQPSKSNIFDLQPLVNLIYWRDVKKSGAVFGVTMLILLSLAYLSFISVVAYTSLMVLTGTISFRLYKNIMQAVQKSQDGHPFKKYLDVDTNLPSEKMHEMTDILLKQLNSTVSELKRLFLVEDLIDSVKFGCLLWCLTYLGSWFNGLTLIILGVVALFTLPKVYEQNQAQIDQYIGVARTHVNDIMTKVRAAIPIGNKEKAQ